MFWRDPLFETSSVHLDNCSPPTGKTNTVCLSIVCIPTMSLWVMIMYIQEYDVWLWQLCEVDACSKRWVNLTSGTKTSDFFFCKTPFLCHCKTAELIASYRWGHDLYLLVICISQVKSIFSYVAFVDYTGLHQVARQAIQSCISSEVYICV